MNKDVLRAAIKIFKKDIVLLNKRFSVQGEKGFYLASADIADRLARGIQKNNHELFPLSGLFKIKINLTYTFYFPKQTVWKKSVLIKFGAGINDIENIQAIIMASIQSAFEAMGKSANVEIK
jgi:hypothetical protein